MFIIFNSMNIIKYPSLLAIVLVVSCSCNSKKKSVVVWSKNFPVLGSESSPRTEDINKDGTLDVIMGAGKNEFQESDMGIVAFDGKTGEVIWKQSAPDQAFASATFCDVTGDGVGDVCIGGRSPQLKAIDGSSGKLLWEYHADKFKNDSIIKYARYNFNNSVIIPDQNGDGINDLLTVNGGNALANPYETKNRFPGVLMIFDTKTGDVIAADTMPDGKESYMTPLCFKDPVSNEINILFGTGGETIDGNLYLATASQLKAKKLIEAKVIAREKGHGFIAPASLADINGDGN